MELLIDVPDELPGLPTHYAICRCGHPVVDHFLERGCQAAVSYRPEAMGGGLGSSRCECAHSDMREICVIPAEFLSRFRASPLRNHALLRGLSAVKNSFGDEGLSRIEWDREQLRCLTGTMAWAASDPCSDGGMVNPYYQGNDDGIPDGTRTEFFCKKHANALIGQNMLFERIPKHVSVARRKERIAKHREMLEKAAYQKAHGMESMGWAPKTVEEFQREIRSRNKKLTAAEAATETEESE